MEMRDEILTSASAQQVVTSGHQVSELQDNEFNWEHPNLKMDAVSKPGIDIIFSLSSFNELEMGSVAANFFLPDDEEDKENSLRPSTTPVSERSSRPPL